MKRFMSNFETLKNPPQRVLPHASRHTSPRRRRPPVNSACGCSQAQQIVSSAPSLGFPVAVGETIIDNPFLIPVETPTEGRRGCSRMTVSPTATFLAVVHEREVLVAKEVPEYRALDEELMAAPDLLWGHLSVLGVAQLDRPALDIDIQPVGLESIPFGFLPAVGLCKNVDAQTMRTTTAPNSMHG